MQFIAISLLCAFLLLSVESRPTIYMLNENDRLEPALVPVSSTVIPMPVYKVGTRLEVSGGKKEAKPSESVKLITGNKKKVTNDNVAINIKQISKESKEEYLQA